MPKRLMICANPVTLYPGDPNMGAFGVNKGERYLVEKIGVSDLVKVYHAGTGDLLVRGLSEKRFRPVRQVPRKPIEYWS